LRAAPCVTRFRPAEQVIGFFKEDGSPVIRITTPKPSRDLRFRQVPVVFAQLFRQGGLRRLSSTAKGACLGFLSRCRIDDLFAGLRFFLSRSFGHLYRPQWHRPWCDCLSLWVPVSNYNHISGNTVIGTPPSGNAHRVCARINHAGLWMIAVCSRCCSAFMLPAHS
jgi:hypothetical protein